MKTWCLVAAVVVVARFAFAGPPSLVPYRGPDLTVSFPKGWTVAQQSGMYIAQQDPKRSDAADVVFIYSAATATATEDGLLDAITGKLATGFKASQRAAISARGGRYLVGDGTVAGIKVRIGAIAIVASGHAVISVLVAKPGDFDVLGGLALATAVGGSFSLAGGDTTQAGPTASPAPPPPSSSSGTPSVADITGEWTEDRHANQAYADAHGNYSGYYATLTSTRMNFDGKGHFTLKGRYAIVSSKGASGGNIDQTGTISIKGNVLIYMQSNWKAPEYFYIRGWEVLPSLTRMKLNGQHNSEADALRAANPHFATNLDTFWVHSTK